MEEFEKELIDRHKNLFSEFFDDKEELQKFILNELEYKDNNIPRKMLNSTERLVSLSDDIYKIRQNRESLQLFFLVVCIETLYTINIDNQRMKKIKKSEMVIDFLSEFVLKKDRVYIRENVSYIKQACSSNEIPISNEVSMEVFGLMLYEIRNNFVHEGN